MPFASLPNACADGLFRGRYPLGTTAAPVFNPPAGTYQSAQSVSISSASPNALIYYTLDGSTPSINSALYSAPIAVPAPDTETITAIAIAPDFLQSPPAAALYQIQSQTATPTMSPIGGTYSSTQVVFLSCATPGASIYFTMDGSTPTTSSQQYTAPLNVNTSRTVKAIAAAGGYTVSNVATQVYIISAAQQTATPTFAPAAGSYGATQSVSISCATPSATIYYTTDGSTPTTSSAVYSTPIQVAATQTINAIAIASGFTQSAVGSAAYTILIAAAPSFSPGPGSYSTAQSVTLSCSLPSSGANIYYTTDGSTPTTSSTLYTGPITVSATETINAIATASGYETSAVASGLYGIGIQLYGSRPIAFYVSPTGSDSNAGTLTAPWAPTSLINKSINANNLANFALTHAQVIGFLPGFFDYSTYFANSSGGYPGAMQIDGGLSGSPTCYISCNSSGAYAPRTAMLNGKINGGGYGGGFNYPINGSLMAHMPGVSCTHSGYITVDGLIFTGCTYKAIRVGGGSAGEGAVGIPGALIQNCVFTGNNGEGLSTDNMAGVWIDGTIGAIVQNNYFHDNYGASGPNSNDHLSAVILWGPNSGSTYSSGNIIQNNTIVNSGDIWGKYTTQEQSTIQGNYIDMSMYSTPAVSSAVFDFSGQPTSGLTGTTYFRNNVLLIAATSGIGRMTQTDADGYTTPIVCNNNTIILSGGSRYPALWLAGLAAANGGLSVFNNLIQGSGDTSGYKTVLTNPAFPGLFNYNMYMAAATFALRTNANVASVLATYSTPSAFGAGIAANGGISGAEANSIVGTATFTNIGTHAQFYQLNAGSTGQNSGYTNGTGSGGAACDMGAWGNLPSGLTYIGSMVGGVLD